MTQYAVKISDQGQITLPKDLRIKIGAQSGSRVILTVADDTDNKVAVSNRFPIENYFGKFSKTITGGQDATKFIRNMRDDDIARRTKLQK